MTMNYLKNMKMLVLNKYNEVIRKLYQFKVVFEIIHKLIQLF